MIAIATRNVGTHFSESENCEHDDPKGSDQFDNQFRGSLASEGDIGDTHGAFSFPKRSCRGGSFSPAADRCSQLRKSRGDGGPNSWSPDGDLQTNKNPPVWRVLTTLPPRSKPQQEFISLSAVRSGDSIPTTFRTTNLLEKQAPANLSPANPSPTPLATTLLLKSSTSSAGALGGGAETSRPDGLLHRGDQSERETSALRVLSYGKGTHHPLIQFPSAALPRFADRFAARLAAISSIC